jgi:serine/threonine-protein kinase
MSEMFPRQFGKYVLLKSLARGGMGEIYLAASGQTGGLSKLCVIKRVITEKTDPAKVNRFLDEAKVVLRLSHANLVSTFDAGDVGGELFIAMELVEGKDLREIWNRCVRTRTRIPVDVALVVVREIARALAYVHTYADLRLVHRDVAPPNILLSYFGEVKLTDFGLARSVLKEEHTAPGVVFGRASYLAPEQARGEVADARTDLYSLGIVLWELLTGQPYMQLAGLDPVTSLSLARNPSARPPSSQAPWLAPELDEIVLKALATDRASRFQSAEELRVTLADTMTRVAPRADSERIAEFLRGLYGDVVGEESVERERLLVETLPLFRGESIAGPRTPRTDVVVSRGRGERVPVDRADRLNPSGGASQPAAARPIGSTASSVTDAPNESLHASALRAREEDSLARQAALDLSGADLPTGVWRGARDEPGEAEGQRTFAGQLIDHRYQIRHRIGEGGMGTVYAAEDVANGRGVAVKILHRVPSVEEQLIERFVREARAASQVGHPHILEVCGVGTTESGCAYLVMELLEGMDLADVLAGARRLEPGRAVRIAVQICQALEAAHASGIIHRDLKPENIFLTAREGQADFVKVLDFGVAHNLLGGFGRLTNPGMSMGTPAYMSPEQSQGKPVDGRSDIYAVGALLHEMLTGFPPFQADSPPEMLAGKRRGASSMRWRRPEIPEELDAITLRALSFDPALRPQTMARFEQELAQTAPFLGSETTATAPTTTHLPPVARAPALDVHGRLGAVPRPVPKASPFGMIEVNVDMSVVPGPRVAANRSRRTLILLLLVVIGGVTAWAATNGAPEIAQTWIRRFRGRSTHETISAEQRGKPPVSAMATAASTYAVRAPFGAAPPSPVDSRSLASPALVQVPQTVQTPPFDRARKAIAAGIPDEAIDVLRPIATQGDRAVRALLGEALVASGWNDAKAFRWAAAGQKAREALALSEPAGPSHGAHALLAETLYAQRDFGPALSEFTKALGESPGDTRLRRRAIRSRRQLHRAAAAPGEIQSMPREAASEQQE